MKWWRDPQYPPSVWTAEDRAAALRDGWRPPRDVPSGSTGKMMPIQAPTLVPPFSLHGEQPSDRGREVDRCSNRLLGHQ
ncbi:MAG: hypothetical protein ACRDLU_00885 [Gaiellaceae bacterium]